ncbi:MAG TPA: L-lactate dehydrogenase [Vitreimonas sp.]|nr:L-lactate dehydrogenase [Vitreimonas sp.]
MSKVAIVGCGKVGMTAAYAMLLAGVCDELVLHGRDRDELIGEQLDLEHGLSFLNSTHVSATDNYADLAGCDVVIISAGAAQKEGETRLDLAHKNLAIIDQIIPQVVEHAPQAIIVMVTNPVDILTYRAYQLADLPKGRVFGTGTTLDTARFRFHLSEFLKVNPRSIHAYILGEHGDTSFPALSSANVGGQLLSDFPNFTEEKALKAFDKARLAAYKIIQAKGATYYAIGVVVTNIIKAILQDNRSVLPVSIPLHNYYGHSGVSLSVPCVVGKNGVEETLKITLSAHEQQQLTHAVNTLKEYQGS